MTETIVNLAKRGYFVRIEMDDKTQTMTVILSKNNYCSMRQISFLSMGYIKGPTKDEILANTLKQLLAEITHYLAARGEEV